MLAEVPTSEREEVPKIVDVAAIGHKEYSPYRGRSLECREHPREWTAEVIVAMRNEPLRT